MLTKTRLQIQQDWEDSIKILGATTGSPHVWDTVFLSIMDRYSSPGRYYHNLSHILHLLAGLELAQTMLTPIEEALLRLCIWYHDLEYNPKKQGNEETSATFFGGFARSMGMPSNIVLLGCQIILSTKFDAPIDHHLKAVMYDLDHSIMGGTEAQFLLYNRNIRLEYRHIPIEEYTAARKSFFKHTKQGGIFRTEVFKNIFEANAQRNIEQYLDGEYPEARD